MHIRGWTTRECEKHTDRLIVASSVPLVIWWAKKAQANIDVTYLIPRE